MSDNKEFIHIVEPYTANVKRLPRHPETDGILNVFYANGVKYYILTGVDAFPMARWGLFSKYAGQFMSGMDYQSWYNTILKIQEICEKYVRQQARFTDVLLITESAKEEVLSLSQMKFATALYICSLFIVEHGEDATQWQVAKAEEKIENWLKEGYVISDFFSISAHYVGIYNSVSSALAADIANQIAAEVEPDNNNPQQAAFTDVLEQVTAVQ